MAEEPPPEKKPRHPDKDADAGGDESDEDDDADEEEEEEEKGPRWLPMESNPDMLNGFLRRMGVAETHRFHDVFGLDDELLVMIPRPCMAMCLLFPSDKIESPRRKDYAKKCLGDAKHGCFYLKQHEEFGNACGTIAMVHIVANTGANIADDSPLKAFINANRGKGATGIGYALCEATAIHEASEDSAEQGGQTACPDRDEDLESHFICFVSMAGRLMELDGCMPGPVDHGPVTEEGFVPRVAKLIRDDFMARDPGNLNFNMIAFAAA